MQFYNLKTKQLVDVPLEQVRKRKSVRTTSGGREQVRYAVVAELPGGVKLFKFVNQETFNELKVPETA